MVTKRPQTFVYPWHPSSQGGARLAGAMKVGLFNRDYHSFGANAKYVLFNWGFTSDIKLGENIRILNEPKKLREAGKTSVFFKKAEKVANVPPYTESIAEAISWLREGNEVLAKGRGGEWVTFDTDPLSFVESGFFTQYKKKSGEFLVHVVAGAVIGIERLVPQQTDDKDAVFNHRFRTRENGFIPEAIDVWPESIGEAAPRIVEALGLDFGCVHFLWNNVTKKSYALGFDGIPILSEELAKEYATALKDFTT